MADAIGHLSGTARERREFLRWGVAGLVVLGSGAWTAQAASTPSNVAAAGPTVRFTLFAARPIADLGFSPRPGAAVQRVAFYPTARSARYEFHGRMPLQFVDAASGDVVAEVTIPPEIREPLLLFTPAEAQASGKLRYQVAVLDDSAAHHPAGALVVVNLSGLALTGTLNDEAISVKAGLNPPVNIPRGAKLSFRTTFKGRAFPAYSGEVKLARNERGLLILFPPFYPGSLEVQARLLVDRR